MNKKKLYVSLAIFIMLMLLAYGIFLMVLFNFARTPIITVHPSLVYEFKSGSSVSKLANDLHRMGYLKNKKLLVLLAKMKDKTRHLQAGEYAFNSGTTPDQILTQISRGEVIKHRITFVEGWRFSDLLKRLEEDVSIQHTLQNLTPAQIMQRINPAFNDPEGLFYPATYYFIKNATDEEILKKSHQKLLQILALAWKNRAANLPYKNAYDALIAASLIEKETAVAIERPYIAGVLVGRLNIRMPLQFDPTIIYALGNHFSGKLTKQDMKVNSPYNSYLHYGLPPTPISMPSCSAINAALNPIMRGYFYFVAAGDGSHVFSQTLEQHNQAVLKLRLRESLEHNV